MSKLTKLELGDIIIALDDIIIPGTGTTFFIYKGQKYRLENFLDKWKEPAWFIVNQNEPEYSLFPSSHECGWFTEGELFEKFNCVKWLRAKKLKKIHESR